MQPNLYAVYVPPDDGLPYLSVAITGKGTIEAHSFDTYAEAFHHGKQLKSVLEPHADAAALAELVTRMQTSPLPV